MKSILLTFLIVLVAHQAIDLKVIFMLKNGNMILIILKSICKN
jgi:hypothetical protein